MGGYYENIKGEIVHYNCQHCLYFRWNEEESKYWCHNTGCEVNEESDACERFINDRDY